MAIIASIIILQLIGSLASANADRPQQATESFRFFCERYFPEVFYLSWSDDHLKVIDKIEQAVLKGGLFALAMPRGSGKTVMMQMACLWSALISATDAGSIVAWPQRHNPDELSAIQHAMNLKLRDEEAFFAEYQNEPIAEKEGEGMLTADNFIVEPFNPCGHALMPLTAMAVGDPFQCTNRKRHFRKILVNQLIRLQSDFYRFQEMLCPVGGGGDHAIALCMPSKIWRGGGFLIYSTFHVLFKYG